MADPFPHPPVVKASTQSLFSAVSAPPALMIPPWGSGLHPISGNPASFMYRPGNMSVCHGNSLHLPQPPVIPANYHSPYEWVVPGNQPSIANRKIRLFGGQLPQGRMPQEAVHPCLPASQCKASQPSKSIADILYGNCYGQLEPAASRPMLISQTRDVIEAWNNRTQGQQVPLNSGGAVYIYNKPVPRQVAPGKIASILQTCSVHPHHVESRETVAAESVAPQNGVVLVLKEIQHARSQKPPAHHVAYYPVPAQSGGLRTHEHGVTSVPILHNACGTGHNPRVHFIQQTPALLDPRRRSDVFIHPTLHRDHTGHLEATPLDFPMAMRQICSSRSQPVKFDGRQRKEPSSPSGHKPRGDGLKTVPRGKSSRAMDISEDPMECLEAPLGKIEIPDIQQLLALTDPLHTFVDDMPKKGSNNPFFPEDSHFRKDKEMSSFNGNLHRGNQRRPALEIPPPPQEMHTALERDKCVTAVTQSGTMPSSTDSKQKRACPEPPGEEVACPTQPSGKNIHLSGVPEISTLDVNDIKKNSEISSTMKITDVPFTSASEGPHLKASSGLNVGKDSLKKSQILASLGDQAPTDQLGKMLCVPESAQTSKPKIVFGTGSPLSDSRPLNSTSKRKNIDSHMPPAKKAKSQCSEPNVQKSLQKSECITPGTERGSATVLPVIKPKVDDKAQKDRNKRKRGSQEKEQRPIKLHRSHLSLHMFESVQVFHRLGKKGEGAEVIPAAENPTAPLSTEDHAEGTAHLPTQVHENSSLGIQRDPLLPDTHNSSNKSVLPRVRENTIDRFLMALNSSDNATLAARIHPGKSARKEANSSLSSKNMTDSKHVGEKQTLPKESVGSPPGKRIPHLKDPGAVGGKVNQGNKTCHLNSNRHSPSAVRAPIHPALNYQCTARPPAVSKGPATTAPGQVQSPVKIAPPPAASAHRLTVELEVSIPISKTQRPEREAMKKRAQYERERACLYTSMGKLQFFVQREKDLNTDNNYGLRKFFLRLSKNYLDAD